MFWQFLRTEKKVEPEGLTEGLADAFARLTGRGHSIADLLEHYADDFGHLTPTRLADLSSAFRRYIAWRKRLDLLRKLREDGDLPDFPEKAIEQATTPDQLDALFRCARMCPLESANDPSSWVSVLGTGIEIWRRAVTLAQKETEVRCDLAAGAASESAAHYDEYIKTQEQLGEIAAHRWLAMRRGAQEGVLSLELTLPTEAIVEQVELLRAGLAIEQQRSSESIAAELVLDDLHAWLLRMTDDQAQTAAIDNACQAFSGLLRSQPAAARRTGAIYLSQGATPAAVIVADREGELISQRVLKPQGQWLPKALEIFSEFNVQQVVIPARTSDHELLTETENGLRDASLHVIRVRTAALAEARRPLTDPPLRLGAATASALILARRALDPMREWASVDPVNIGIAEYQHDIDENRLRAALQQTVALCRLGRKRKGAQPAVVAPRGGAATSRLNPMVQKIGDLRPGMSVAGLVTNISHFGAFINIGLPQEGLVHISELSDDYVGNPNEVVQIGQQVAAHVLGVDPQRQRISLSLKTQRASQQETNGHSGRAKPARPRPRSRAEALASLERLFKK
ncbi:MAG: S1 RNA-binding domain-containing protein [Deltaproteobacteria bacterium]|nr:S1 RNA-binding domain-containing protein [Deltaproteobacteria bacterium]